SFKACFCSRCFRATRCCNIGCVRSVERSPLESLALLFGSSLDAGTALALAALGLLVNERSGVVNLGAEGMMLVGALAGFACAVHSGSDTLAFVGGACAGAALAALFALLVVYLNTNQYATGLAASLFGTGLSAFAGQSYSHANLGSRAHFSYGG